MTVYIDDLIVEMMKAHYRKTSYRPITCVKINNEGEVIEKYVVSRMNYDLHEKQLRLDLMDINEFLTPQNETLAVPFDDEIYGLILPTIINLENIVDELKYWNRTDADFDIDMYNNRKDYTIVYKYSCLDENWKNFESMRPINNWKNRHLAEIQLIL